MPETEEEEGEEKEEQEEDVSPPRTRRSTGGAGVSAASIRPVLKVGDAVQAFMGATGPYNAIVAEVHDGGAEYTLDWEDDDPNARRPAA